MGEFWINFLVIPRSDYLKEMKIVLSIESQENLHKFFFMLSLFIIWENNGKPNDLINNNHKNELYIYLIHEMNHELIIFNHLFKHLFEIVKFYCATNVLFDTIEKKQWFNQQVDVKHGREL